MDEDVFIKSDIGAQAAWKGFSSQTLYIAYRLVTDIQGYEYYPEDIEDLVVKYNGEVIEAVQVKNITATLQFLIYLRQKHQKAVKVFSSECVVCILNIPISKL